MQLRPDDPEENWTGVQNVVHSPAVDTLGHASRKRQDWFDENDEEIQWFPEEKHRLHKEHQDNTSSVSKKATYNNICKTVQSILSGMQGSWLSSKADEIQSFADGNDTKFSTMHLRQFMAQNALGPPNFLVQIEVHFW